MSHHKPGGILAVYFSEEVQGQLSGPTSQDRYSGLRSEHAHLESALLAAPSQALHRSGSSFSLGDHNQPPPTLPVAWPATPSAVIKQKHPNLLERTQFGN